MIKQNKRAELYLIALLTLNVLAFVLSLIPNKSVSYLGCYAIFVSIVLTVVVIIESMQSTDKDDGQAKFKVWLISCACLVLVLASTNFLVKVTTQTQFKDKISHSQDVQWELNKPKTLKNGYREGYYILTATTPDGVKLKETIEPVYVNKLNLTKGVQANDLSLYEYEEYILVKTPFGKYKTNSKVYYELKE